MPHPGGFQPVNTGCNQHIHTEINAPVSSRDIFFTFSEYIHSFILNLYFVGCTFLADFFYVTAAVKRNNSECCNLIRLLGTVGQIRMISHAEVYALAQRSTFPLPPPLPHRPGRGGGRTAHSLQTPHLCRELNLNLRDLSARVSFSVKLERKKKNSLHSFLDQSDVKLDAVTWSCFMST